MRNGLLLAVGVLALALLPAIGNASAPMFTDVPGVIILNEDGGSTMSASGVFTFSSAAVDSDSTEADLVWTFVEDASELDNVDPILGGGVFQTLEGVGAVASKSAARTATVGQSVNQTATDFSLVTGKLTTGTAASAAAFAAGTTHAPTASDDLYTTIVIAVHDESNNVAYQTVVVKADYDAPGATNRGGLYETVDSGLVSAYVFTDNFVNGVITGANSGGVLTLTSVDPSWTFTNPFNGKWGYGDYGSPVFTLEGGYVYRAAVTVASDAAVDAIGEIRMSIKEATFKCNGEFDYKTQLLGSADPKGPTAGGVRYEVVYEPPQASRLDGVAYNTDYRLYVDHIAFWNTQGGVDIDFSNIEVSRFESPQDSEQGVLWYADTIDEWQTVRDAAGSTVSAEMGFPGTGNGRGFVLLPRGLGAVTISGSLFDLPNTEHTDLDQYRGNSGTAVGDAITTIRHGSSTQNGGELEIYSVKAENSGFVGCLNEIVIGEAVGATDASKSWIPSGIVTSLLDKVYYRTSVSARAGSSDTSAEMPQMFLRMGTPNGNLTGNFSYNETSGVGPSPSSWTTYNVWTKGYVSAAAMGSSTYFNSWTLKLQVVDTNTLGFANSGGTISFDTVKTEIFPVARYAD